jgi:hypothetical protein
MQATEITPIKNNLATLDMRIGSLHDEVKSNHGHVTKRLFQHLEDSFAALKDNRTTKGNTLVDRLSALESMVGTTMSNFENRITALEERGARDNPATTPNDGRVPPTPSPEPAANRDLPTSNLPDGDERTPPTNATINFCVAWACSHAQ